MLPAASATPKHVRWKLLLLLPYLGLCFPAIYARSTPYLFGFPFFYWYQFLWVLLTSALLFAVYRKLRTKEEPPLLLSPAASRPRCNGSHVGE